MSTAADLYRLGIDHGIVALAYLAGVLTIAAPIALAGALLRPRIRRVRWRVDAWTFRAR